MSTLSTRSIAAFALTAALTGVSLPAHADMKVKFGDLDLSKPEGITAL